MKPLLLNPFGPPILAILLVGCVTTEQTREQTRDSIYIRELESELKSPEDWERWHKQQKQDRDALFIIEDR